MSSTPTRAAAFALAAALSLAGVLFVVLYALTSDVQRPELLELVKPFITSAVAGVPAIIAAVFGVQVHRQGREQSATLAKVEHQTNGALTERLNAAINGALDARGLLPQQRAGDGPAGRHAAAAPTEDVPA